MSYTPLFLWVLLGLVRDLSEVPYLVLYGFRLGCAVLFGLVPICGSMIIRRSSRSPQGFGVSLPVAWSHPTLVRYKASYPLFSTASYPLLFNLLSWRSGHSLADSYRYLSYGIRAIVVTVGFVITHLSILFVYHPLLFSSITYICALFVSYSPVKSHTKKSYCLLLVLLISCRLCSSSCSSSLLLFRRTLV